MYLLRNVLVLLLLLGFLPQLATAAAPLRAGAATTNITPWISAWTFARHPFRGVHDELKVRALVLDNGSTRLALAIVDSALMPRDVIDAAKHRVHRRTGLPVEQILIAATHTHSAPVATPVLDSAVDDAYVDFLVIRMADAIELALNRLEPAEIGWAMGQVPGEVFNRRSRMKPGSIPANPFGGADAVKMNPAPGSPDILAPAGPVDPSVAVLGVRTPDGRPIAMLVNYSLHYVGGTGGQISADYFGYVSDRLQELLGASSAFVGMLSNGASGDVNNIDFSRPREPRPPYEKIREVGDKVAGEAARLYRGMRFHRVVPLAAQQVDLELQTRRPDAAELLQARAILMESESISWSDPKHLYARETLLLDDFPASVPVILQAMRIGDVGIAAIPAEPFAQIGLDLRAKSPFATTFTVSYANGYYGYLPTPDQHLLGGYETWRARSSFLETAASDKIVQTLVQLFQTLR